MILFICNFCFQSPGNSSQNTTNMIPAGTPVLVSPQGGGIGQTLPPGTMISGPNMNSVSGTVTPGQITGAINLTIANGESSFCHSIFFFHSLL